MEKKQVRQQLELFSGSVDLPESTKDRQTFFQNRIHLNIEHIVMLSVVVLMAIIFSFSLGVEKGKRVVNVLDTKNLKTSEVKLEKEPVAIKPEQQIKEQVSPKKIEEKELEPKKKEIDKYTIQVASFKKRSSVEEEAKGLQNKGYEIIVMPKGDWIILCVGKFGNRQEAKSLLSELKKKYKDCLIREL